jgi:hypothetical protein
VDEDGALQFRKDMYRYDKYPDIPADLKSAAPGADNLIAASDALSKLGKTN